MNRDDVLLQEFYKDDPWKLLVCCILLNQTGRKQVDKIIEPLLSLWYDAHEMAKADLAELTEVLKPLGLQNRRAMVLKAMSKRWVDLLSDSREKYPPDIETVEYLPGVGDYAADSYSIFVLGKFRMKSYDKELVRWADEHEVSYV